jgi:rubrerythrin
MSDLIKREDAIATIGVMYERCDTYDITDYRDLMLEAVKVLPSADRLQGEWIDKGWKGDWQFETDGRGNCWYEYECSECGFHNKGSKSNYCPNCGADMRGKGDETN